MKPWIARALLALMALLLIAGSIALFLPFVDCPGSTNAWPPILSEKMREQHQLRSCPDCAASGKVSPWKHWTLKTNTSFPHDKEILAAFRAKASPKDLQRFDSLRASQFQVDRDRALQMLLLELSRRELESIGIIEVTEYERGMYFFAEAFDDAPSREAIDGALGRAKITGYMGMLLGDQVRWSVSKRDFVRARRALLEDRETQAQGVIVISPRLSLGP